MSLRPPSFSDDAFRQLFEAAQARRLTRRQVMQRALALGLSLPAISWLIAACGGDDDDNEAATATKPAASATSATSNATATSAGAATTTGGTTTSSGGATPSSAAGGPTATTLTFGTISPATATGVGSAKGGGTLTLIFEGDIPDLDPQSSYDFHASAVYFGTYEMLVRLKGSNMLEYQPMLAESWESNADKTEWTFKIPAGVKFHDGTDCDADAVAKSFQRFHKLHLGPSPDIQKYVANPDTDITAVDKQTVKFKISPGNDIFLAMLASQYGPLVVSPTAMDQNKTADDPYAHEWFRENVVGTGPYVLKEHVRDDHITLERFADYHGGWDGPHFDEIVFRIVPENSTRRSLVESGDADATTQNLTPKDIAEIEKAGNLQVLRYDSTNAVWIDFNYVKLADPNVRTAFAYAYPYDDVRSGVYEDLIIRSSGALTPNNRGYDPNGFIFDTDLDKAKQMLTDAGWDFGKKLEFWVDSSSATYKAAAELFQANLSQIGITMDIVAKDTSTLIDFFYGGASGEERPEFWDGGWWPDFNDAENEYYPNFYSKSQQTSGGQNQLYYANARVDEILDQFAKGINDEDTYNQLSAECNDILVRQDPAAAFYGGYQWYTVMQSNIKGFVSNPIYIGTYNIYDMYRED